MEKVRVEKAGWRRLLPWGVCDLPQGRALPAHQGRESTLLRLAAPPPSLPSRSAPIHNHQRLSPRAPLELAPTPGKRHFDTLTARAGAAITRNTLDIHLKFVPNPCPGARQWVGTEGCSELRIQVLELSGSV